MDLGGSIPGHPSVSKGLCGFPTPPIYKAESLIALLYGGEQLRREIDARLEDFAAVDQAGADNFRRDNQELLKRPADGSSPGFDDSLRAFLLRILEAVHSGDPDLAAAAIREHITQSGELLVKKLSQTEKEGD